MDHQIQNDWAGLGVTKWCPNHTTSSPLWLPGRGFVSCFSWSCTLWPFYIVTWKKPSGALCQHWTYDHKKKKKKKLSPNLTAGMISEFTVPISVPHLWGKFVIWLNITWPLSLNYNYSGISSIIHMQIDSKRSKFSPGKQIEILTRSLRAEYDREKNRVSLSLSLSHTHTHTHTHFNATAGQSSHWAYWLIC